MNSSVSHMSLPPGGPPPGYSALPPGYGVLPPQKNNTAKIILIVLAVVFGGGIFLVAILAAILFPVFSKVRGNARLSVCLTNVRQIELGLVQYQQDHNNTFPPSAADYKAAVFPYVKTEQVFRCPADSEGSVDYSLNTNLQNLSYEKIKDPSRTVAVYEGTNQTLNFRHDGKAVVGFADGHDRALTADQAAGLKWEP